MSGNSASPLLPRGFAAAALIAASAHAFAAQFELDRSMDEASARALLNRFGYGATPASLAAAEAQTPRQYLMRAIREGSRLPPEVSEEIASLPIAQPLDPLWARLGPGGSDRDGTMAPEARKALQQQEKRFASAAVQARMLTMANSDNPGHEALLSFWLNHFSIFAPKNFDKLLAWDYVRAIEEAMRADSFEALLRASFYHPAMQLYLDNAQSTAANSQAAEFAAGRGRRLGINENLAREMLELHTMGVGSGYSQKDVQELARIITGAGVYSPRMRDQALARAGAVRVGLFLFDPRRHDFGAKTFLGASFPAGQGMAEIDRALHLMATHPATAQRIARKLAERFLSDDPPREVIDAMASGFWLSGGRISAALLPLLQSQAFADSLAQPQKFKEPIDYVTSAARAACGDHPVGNRLVLSASVLDMGEAPLMRSTPDGYGTSEADWMSPAAMAKRVRLAMGVAAERVPLAQGEDDRVGRIQALANGANNMANGAKILMRGTACAIDGPTLERLVGPISAQTQSASSALGPRERAALLLASPEFMRR